MRLPAAARLACALGLVVPLLFPEPLDAAAPTVSIASTAQCHGQRCFVALSFRTDVRRSATVSIGGAAQALTVEAGRSTRVVGTTRAALAGAVRVTIGGSTTTRTVTRRAMTVNTASARCATLAATDAYLSVGPPNAWDAVSLPSVGTRRAVTIFVDFPGAAGVGDPRAETAAWTAASVAHTKRSSYGRFSLDVVDTTNGWVRLPLPVSSYGMSTYDAHRVYIQAAIDAADDQIDFTDVELVLVVPSDAAGLSGSQTFRGLVGSLTTDEGSLRSSVTFGSDAVGSDSVVFSHEVAHTLGLPDLYDPTSTGDLFLRYTGGWDFMANAWIDPTDLFAWQRSDLGWLDPGQMLCASDSGRTVARLAPLSTSGGTKAVFVRTGRYTGLVVENRQATGNDADICRSGALVYTLDSRVSTLTGPIKVRGGSAHPVGCGTRPRFDAPLRVGDSLTVGAVTVTVLGRTGTTLEVSVTVTP